jgi:hypothetical protein
MTALERAMEKADEVFDLVSGKFKTWDSQVKAQIKKLEDWRTDQVVSYSANQFKWSSVPNVIFPSTLKADNVESNRGSGYDPATGIFTVPSNGSYLFSASLAVSTLTGLNKDGSKANFNDRKWHEDMHINLNRYDIGKRIDGTGTGADKIGEIWIGQDGGLITDNTTQKWFRKNGSTTAIHYLKKGEKISVDFVVWNEAVAGDKVHMSFNFCGTKLH